MKIGDVVTRVPETIVDQTRVKGVLVHKPIQGVVVYIHPKGRFHTVEFEIKGFKMRENFKGVED